MTFTMRWVPDSVFSRCPRDRAGMASSSCST